MAASYWDSTQRKHWTFTKDQLASMRQKLEDEDPALVQSFGLPQLRHLNIFFNQRESKSMFSKLQDELWANREVLLVQKSTALERDWEHDSKPWLQPKSISNASIQRSKFAERIHFSS